MLFNDSEPTFLHPPLSQNGGLITITAAEIVWRTMKGNHYPHGKTTGTICAVCDCNRNQTVGWFVDALKTSSINGLAFRRTNCKDHGVTLLDNLESIHRAFDGSSQNFFTSHGNDCVPDNYHAAQRVQKDKGAAVVEDDVGAFSVT
jgi:hypothetical protein